MLTKVFLIDGLDGNILAQGLLNEGEILKFGSGGRYIGKFPMTFYMGRTREIDVVSIVNVENELELAYIIDGVFKKCPIYADINDLIRWVNVIDNMVFIGRRVDTEGGIEYNQYLYGFKKGTLKEKQLLGVLKVNG